MSTIWGRQDTWSAHSWKFVSFIFSLISGEPVAGAVMQSFDYLGGVGVRERSRYAAAIICVSMSGTR